MAQKRIVFHKHRDIGNKDRLFDSVHKQEGTSNTLLIPHSEPPSPLTALCI